MMDSRKRITSAKVLGLHLFSQTADEFCSLPKSCSQTTHVHKGTSTMLVSKTTGNQAS